jgi:outer membrane protein OmpA-like peptidoglycan-associated protein
LFFTSGSDNLTSESADTITSIKSEITNYPATEINVIGHTDSVGKAEDNDALSVKRAMAARAILIESGINPEIIEAQGRGERELLIKTGDEVAEPKNRRVEVNMR